jgi:hypothetical protein
MDSQSSIEANTRSRAKPLTPEILARWREQISPASLNLKRKHHREDVYPDIVQVQLLRYRGTPIAVHARARDLSETGIGLTAREEIGTGEFVDLQFYLGSDLYSARAFVVHSTQTVGNYKVGLRFVFE